MIEERSEGKICLPWATRLVIYGSTLFDTGSYHLQNSCYIAGCFYTDTSGIFETYVDAGSATAVDVNITSTLQATVNSDKRSQWLILVRPQGVMEVCSTSIMLPDSFTHMY